MKKSKISVFTDILIVLIFIYLLIGFFPSKDSTDPIDGVSGLKLYIDNMTGCHYLSGGFFNKLLIKRTDITGNHICVGYMYEPKELQPVAN